MMLDRKRKLFFTTLIGFGLGCFLSVGALPLYAQEAVAEAEPGTVARAEFEIEKSRLNIKIYRAGWAGKLGHNHVIYTDQLRGLVLVGETPESSMATLEFSPIDLEVDLPEKRAAAGEGFESVPADKDKRKTRDRMLGKIGFVIDKFPVVKIEVKPANEYAELSIALKDKVTALRVPIQWNLQGDRLVVDSKFSITFSELGLVPFRVFSGALAVAEEIDIQVYLEAVKKP